MQTYGHAFHTGQDQPEKISKRDAMKKIMEEENLDHPKDSVEFLEYAKKHQKKTDHHKRRLHKFSKFIMVVGLGALALMAYRTFAHRSGHDHHDKHHKKSHHGHHKLGASAETEEFTAYAQTFSTISLAIWGMVVAKAKTGLDAASKNDTESVGAIVKKVGYMSAMIMVASVFQLMGSAKSANPVKAVQEASHKLQAASNHPASFYDKSSSHYMGGAHNVLLQAAEDFQAPQKARNTGDAHNVLLSVAQDFQETGELSATVSTQASMGGAHNVAMAVLVEKTNDFMRKQSGARVSSGKSWFRKPTAAQLKKNMGETGAFVSFIFTLGLCMTYFVTLKTYHAHLEKNETLQKLIANPNARVASGKKGKQVIKKIMQKTKKVIVDEEAPLADKYDQMIKAAKANKVKKIVEEKAEQLLSGYAAPRLQAVAPQAPQAQTTYQLVEPMQVQPQTQAPVYYYPQNFEVHAPLPMPQVAKVAINQPEPMREPLPAKQPDLASLPKKELIKALLMQLAKEE